MQTTTWVLGVLAVQVKQPAAGLPHFRTALEASPNQGQFWLSYIDALLQDGQSDAARQVLAQGRHCGLQGEAVEALAERLCGEKAVMPAPVPKAAMPAKKVQRGKAALRPEQHVIEALAALCAEGRCGEAETLARSIAVRYPRQGFGWKVLGVALLEQGRMADALQATQKALALGPGDPEVHSNLGAIFTAQGRYKEAEAAYRRALAIKPGFAEVLNNLGKMLYDQGRVAEAEASYRQALQINPRFHQAHEGLGMLLKDHGSLSDAEACFRRALEIKPDYVEAFSDLLFTMCYTASGTPERGLVEARQYGRMAGKKADACFSAWQCASQPERLRVGMVSGDLRTHPVGFFLENLLAHVDPARVDLFAYPTHHKADELAARIRPYFSAWKSLVGLPDDAAARLIHADGVHILLDLSGHTVKNRLTMFARKPAPVQASWLGYFATTGVAEMDYLLGDPYVTPPEEEGHFTEDVWRLPESYLCFTPPGFPLEVGLLPALSAGCITFGCFNNLTKMNDAVAALWARVLKAVPGSRLFLKTAQLNNPAMCETTRQRFAALGIAAERLILEGASPRAELLAAYNRVDIALDPFPYPGGTTSVEGLWMGVPVITRRGDRFLSHVGESIAHNAGLADWIAVDEDDYVAKAVAYASDLERLAQLRAGLRQQVLASPLFDAPRFARNFEAALWGMWQRWQEQQGNTEL